MSRRNRIFLGILGLFALVVGLLLFRVSTDLDSRYRESTEESLVDTAQLLAAFIEADIKDQQVDPTRLRIALHDVFGKRFEARIFDITKRQVDLRIYLTDAHGMVLFDSSEKAEGQDYSGWRDVSKVLAGEYGARTTLADAERPETAVMYVAAPVLNHGDIVGVVSVGKPVTSQRELVISARQKLFYVGMITVVAFLFLLIVITVWLARPFGLTADLVRVIRQESFRHPGRMWRRLKAVITSAFNDMRDALAGRSHTEEYVQTLTHELKSPLTAIRGAAELLREPLPEAQRARFAANISEQVQRLQNLADRLLELASLEKRRTLDDIRTVNLSVIASEAVNSLEPVAKGKNVALHVHIAPNVLVEGDKFLLFQALVNILANAIDFSPRSSTVEITSIARDKHVELFVRDHGPGVPDYALDRIYEKFYSLRRPDSGSKSSGLGLAFVREIVILHGGESWLENHPDGGTVAILSLPSTIAAKKIH
ncbi:MAG: two-component system sensor histidine kinase CreC [Burkholderiaceae bacterium]